MGEKRYSIADVAKKINVAPHLIHHWEDELALDIPRDDRGFRYYRKQELELLRSVEHLRIKGFRIKAIKLVVNDIKRVEDLPPDKLLELRDKLDIAMGVNSLDEAIQFERGTLPHKEEKKVAKSAQPETKLDQFKQLMTEIVLEALRINNEELSTRVQYSVSEQVVQDMEYMLRKKEDKEAEHYRLLDKAITMFREAEGEAACTVNERGRKGIRK